LDARHLTHLALVVPPSFRRLRFEAFYDFDCGGQFVGRDQLRLMALNVSENSLCHHLWREVRLENRISRKINEVLESIFQEPNRAGERVDLKGVLMKRVLEPVLALT